jgi:hypothetical protein
VIAWQIEIHDNDGGQSYTRVLPILASGGVCGEGGDEGYVLQFGDGPVIETCISLPYDANTSFLGFLRSIAPGPWRRDDGGSP